MTEATDPILQGIAFSIMGILVVFSFLVLMVIAISVSAKVIAWIAPHTPVAAVAAPAEPKLDEAMHVAVVLAAVRHAQKGRA